jgi:hypothetical protein
MTVRPPPADRQGTIGEAMWWSVRDRLGIVDRSSIFSLRRPFGIQAMVNDSRRDAAAIIQPVLDQTVRALILCDLWRDD